MAGPKVSIKWPSIRSLERRLKGLAEIEKRVVNSRPEPFYGQLKVVGKDDKGLNKWDYTKGKSDIPEGRTWKQMRFSIHQLREETEKLLTMARHQAKIRASQAEATPNGN